MHRKLLHQALAFLGNWAYQFKVWLEDSVLHRIDHWTDYFDDHK